MIKISSAQSLRDRTQYDQNFKIQVSLEHCDMRTYLIMCRIIGLSIIKNLPCGRQASSSNDKAERRATRPAAVRARATSRRAAAHSSEAGGSRARRQWRAAARRAAAAARAGSAAQATGCGRRSARAAAASAPHAPAPAQPAYTAAPPALNAPSAPLVTSSLHRGPQVSVYRRSIEKSWSWI